MVFQIKYPVYAIWDVTLRCNANCIHCYANAGMPLSNELNTEEAFQLIDELYGIGVYLLAFGGGEPLLRPDVFDLLQYAVDKGLFVGVGTNGLLINRQIARRLKEISIGRVHVSLDGPSPEVHEAIRGVPGLFNAALNAIRILKEAGIPVSLGYTPIKHNYMYAMDMINLGLKLDVDVVNLSEYVPTGRGGPDLNLPPEVWKSIVTLWFVKRSELKEKMKLMIHDCRVVLFRDLMENVVNMESFRGCQAGRTTCAIKSNGDVYPCIVFPLNLGNIREKPLKKILDDSEDLKRLHNRELLKGKCGVCDLKYNCGGCRAIAFAETGDYLGEDTRCWYNPPSFQKSQVHL